MAERKIFCIVGDGNVGKTTYIEQIWPVGTALRIHFGQIYRTAIGMQNMIKDPNPNACIVTERMTRKIVEGALETSILSRLDIVFDGFPRTVDQFHFLLASISRILPYRSELTVRRLVPKDLRPEREGEQAVFDKLRKPHADRDWAEVEAYLVAAKAVYSDGKPRVHAYETIYV